MELLLKKITWSKDPLEKPCDAGPDVSSKFLTISNFVSELIYLVFAFYSRTLLARHQHSDYKTKLESFIQGLQHVQSKLFWNYREVKFPRFTFLLNSNSFLLSDSICISPPIMLIYREHTPVKSNPISLNQSVGSAYGAFSYWFYISPRKMSVFASVAYVPIMLQKCSSLANTVKVPLLP